MHVTYVLSLCGRGLQAFVTEAVSLGELLHEEALFGLTCVKKLEYPETLIAVCTLPLCHISSSLGMARPFNNKVEKGWKMYRLYGGRS